MLESRSKTSVRNISGGMWSSLTTYKNDLFVVLVITELLIHTLCADHVKSMQRMSTDFFMTACRHIYRFYTPMTQMNAYPVMRHDLLRLHLICTTAVESIRNTLNLEETLEMQKWFLCGRALN